jgi:general secretion pathway protein A
MGALLGQAGMGKSLLLRVAARQIKRKRGVVVLVDAVGASARDFLQDFGAGLAIELDHGVETARLSRRIADRLAENRLQQTDTVLLVDNAGQAGPDVLQQIFRLVRLDASPAARWTIVCAAESEQAARWSGSLRELFDLRIELSPWEQSDTVGYVQTALVEAGRFEPLFTEAALGRLHELAAGIPRRVTRLADYALLAAAAAELDSIDESMVEAADEEIGWPMEAGAKTFY